MPRSDSRERRGYGPAYRKARARLLEGNPPCHWCGKPATTADHEPPIAVVGHPHLNLVPACLSCNLSKGGRVRRRDVSLGNPMGDW